MLHFTYGTDSVAWNVQWQRIEFSVYDRRKREFCNNLHVRPWTLLKNSFSGHQNMMRTMSRQVSIQSCFASVCIEEKNETRPMCSTFMANEANKHILEFYSGIWWCRGLLISTSSHEKMEYVITLLNAVSISKTLKDYMGKTILLRIFPWESHTAGGCKISYWCVLRCFLVVIEYLLQRDAKRSRY